MMIYLLLISGLFMGWSLGSVDSASAFGTAVATRVVKYRTAVTIIAIMVIAGAFIGASIGALMILAVSPIKSLVFIAFIIILQQLEENLIYPKVVGQSTGLPGLWVLAAVTIGGGVMGVVGMLLSVPLTAFLWQLLKNDLTKRYNEKQENEEKVQSED